MYAPSAMPLGDVLKRTDSSSCQQLLHDTPSDIGQAEVAALIAEGQPLVLQAEQMQQSRVQIVDVNRIFEHASPQVVGLADGDSGPNAASGQPDRVGILLMIAAGIPRLVVFVRALQHRSATELGPPDDQRFVEQ